MKIKDAKRIIKDMIRNDTVYDMRASPGPEMYKVEDGRVYGWRRAAPISNDEAIDAFFDWCDQGWLCDDDLFWERSIFGVTKTELEDEWEFFLKKNGHISTSRAEATYQLWYTLAKDCDWTACNGQFDLPGMCRPEKVTGIYGGGPCTVGLLA